MEPSPRSTGCQCKIEGLGVRASVPLVTPKGTPKIEALLATCDLSASHFRSEEKTTEMTVLENQMERNLEHEMETGVYIYGTPPPKDPPVLVYFKKIEAPCLRMPPFP